MNYLWKVILFSLWLGFYCCGGLVHNHHEIEKREVNSNSKEWRLPTDILKSILAPIANLANKANINIPGLASYSTDPNND